MIDLSTWVEGLRDLFGDEDYNQFQLHELLQDFPYPELPEALRSYIQAHNRDKLELFVEDEPGKLATPSVLYPLCEKLHLRDSIRFKVFNLVKAGSLPQLKELDIHMKGHVGYLLVMAREINPEVLVADGNIFQGRFDLNKFTRLKRLKVEDHQQTTIHTVTYLKQTAIPLEVLDLRITNATLHNLSMRHIMPHLKTINLEVDRWSGDHGSHINGYMLADQLTKGSCRNVTNINIIPLVDKKQLWDPDVPNRIGRNLLKIKELKPEIKIDSPDPRMLKDLPWDELRA